ncbi:Origin recognition complex subunit 3 [Apophysomyces sp. BC1015]|nr:Origin recognition complex subunit 3 [Apophysomyces sp. BC1015]KAG0173686.1 Origin recognition complex subunit 3 [Apophysomyces sp. BC1021]
MNQTAVEEISSFVENAHDSSAENDRTALSPGINTPDHDTQFAQIATALSQPLTTSKRKKANYVALLQSNGCPTLKSMMKSMIDQFLQFGDISENTGGHVADDENLEEESEQQIESFDVPYRLTSVQAKASRLPNYDLQILEGWYRHATANGTDDNRPNLVIILQDFESFEPGLLQDFVTICSEYRMRIPIVLIIGVATSTEILHQSLSKSTLGLLRTEKFWLRQSDAWLNRVLETIFIDEADTLKFGARPYKFLLDHFYLHDFSMGKVTASLKYALMHHFYGNPLSIFFPLVGLSAAAEMKRKLAEWQRTNVVGNDHATNLRMLGSFRTYIEGICDSDPKRALQLLDDDDYLLTTALPEFLCDIRKYQQEFKLGIEIIQVLQAQFPLMTMQRKSKRMLLLDALESREGLGGDSEISTVLVRFIRKMEEKSIEKVVASLREVIEREEFGGINDEARAKLAQWDERVQALHAANKEFNARMEKKAKSLKGLVLGTEGGRHTETAKKVELESIEHLKKKGTEGSKVTMDIADWVNQIFSTYLRSFTTLPMYELVYYTNVKLHEKSFAAQPRAATQTALTQAGHYLNCRCCSNDMRGHILPSEPDTCILYKLYLECGRMINLYDWFVAFGCILERERRPTSTKIQENEVQARFIRSVAELQFLGFIKPTQRKTDHVVRLTWSNM